MAREIQEGVSYLPAMDSSVGSHSSSFSRQYFGILLLIFEWGTTWPFLMPDLPVEQIPFKDDIGKVVRVCLCNVNIPLKRFICFLIRPSYYPPYSPTFNVLEQGRSMLEISHPQRKLPLAQTMPETEH